MDMEHGQLHAANALPLEKETLLTIGQVDGWTSETVWILREGKSFCPCQETTLLYFNILPSFWAMELMFREVDDCNYVARMSNVKFLIGCSNIIQN
jgi:hypothetical protein